METNTNTMPTTTKNWNVEVRNLEEFFPTFTQWSLKQGFPTLHIDNVEEVFVCSVDDTDVYSCFVWNTGSAMCLVGFPVKNPFVPYKVREGGLQVLFSKMAEALKKRGYTKMWTTSGTKQVEQALKENDFTLADTNVNVYIKLM